MRSVCGSGGPSGTRVAREKIGITGAVQALWEAVLLAVNPVESLNKTLRVPNKDPRL